MIRLGKLTDYAIVALVQLSRNAGEGSSSAHALAAQTGLPEPTVAKVLKQLARAGMVVSARGAAGGYRIARPAAEISVAEVVAAMEGPIALTACVEHGGGCRAELLCPVRGSWDRVNTAVRRALEDVKLSEMGAPPRPCGGGHHVTHA